MTTTDPGCTSGSSTTELEGLNSLRGPWPKGGAGTDGVEAAKIEKIPQGSQHNVIFGKDLEIVPRRSHDGIEAERNSEGEKGIFDELTERDAVEFERREHISDIGHASDDVNAFQIGI